MVESFLPSVILPSVVQLNVEEPNQLIAFCLVLHYKARKHLSEWALTECSINFGRNLHLVQRDGLVRLGKGRVG